MNRYQFQNSISEYIENELSLSKRKEFENYLKNNPDSLELVNSIKSNIEKLKALPLLQVKETFNDKILSEIKMGKYNRLKSDKNKLIFGFTPMYASLISILAISIIFVSIQLFYPNHSKNYFTSDYSSGAQSQIVTNPSITKEDSNFEPNLDDFDYNDVEIDSAKKPKKNYSNKIQFVND